MNDQIGLRWKIAGAAAIATVTLLSLAGALGYQTMINAARQSQVDFLNARLDEVEVQIESDDLNLVANRQVNSVVLVVRSGEFVPEAPAGAVQVVRPQAGDEIIALVALVDTSRINETFATIRLALWAAVFVVGLLVGATAWMVVDRSLAPVRRLTREAEENLDSPSLDPVSAEDGGEIADLARTVNSMLGRLRSADQDRRRFVSDASHELRTPLMVLGAEAEFAVDHPVASEELAQSVLTQTERLTELVDGLLALAALDEHEADLLDTSTLEHVLDRSDSRSALRELPADLEQLWIPDVSRSLGNLVVNAQRHSKSSVDVSVEVVDDVIHINVDDDGPGVPLHEREQIFGRFYRPDSDRNRSQGGAGLGLAIAKAEVLRAGGSLVVGESAHLGGARFTLSVPVRTG